MLVSALQALEVAARGAKGPLARRLREIHVALQHRSVHAALKLIDRAWRSMPGEAGAIAPHYGRLLLLEDRDPDAALRVLARVDSPDADVAALTARAYFRLRRADDARRGLEAALKAYSVAPQGLLAREATAALESAALPAGGWIGRSPTLEFVGALARGRAADSLQIRIGETPLGKPVHANEQDGRVQFSFAAPVGLAPETLTVLSHGAPLLGSDQRLLPEFALDGRTSIEGRRLSGWARVGWLPTQPVQLRIEDDHGEVVPTRTRMIPLAGYRWPFQMDLRGGRLRGDRVRVLARLPNGNWQPLPDSPLLLPGALRKQSGPARLPRWRRKDPSFKPPQLPAPAVPRTPPIDIIIPVYRGLRETLECIESVLATAGEHARVVVVDDATVDARLAAAVDELAAAGRITLLRNERNLGFVRSVNRALQMNCGQDVVLLNSDTLVFEGWLQRLRAAAYSAPRVGTVTPFSNDGSIASYPHRHGAALGADAAAALNGLAAGALPGISAEIPVGVGFCLYVRHDCLGEIGELDAAAFGDGYGEESDFCLRARARGWTHRLAADVFVYHAGGGSFGARRAALLDRSQRLLNLRYPGYDRFVTEFLTQDPLRALRRQLDERRLADFDGRFVLLVTLALEGGVQRFVVERMDQIRAQGAFPLVLKPQRGGEGRYCELTTDALEVPNLRYRTPTDIGELRGLLTQLRLERIEIEHFLGLNPAVIEAVRTLGVPYDVVIHDYAWICPRITLIDGSGRYCGEPAVAVCEACVRKHGSRMPKTLSVPALRARSATWLGEARTISAPSADTAARLQRYFPKVEITVRPHAPAANGIARSAVAAARPSQANSAARLRVALIGAIGEHKGYRILLECARDAVARGLAIEFVVIGYTQKDRPLLRTGRVEVTGRYVDEEVPHLIAREHPDLVFLPSVWPETWCYALDHALSAGLPVAAFDIGAMAERLRALGRDTLLPLDLDAGQINDRLLEIGAQQNAVPYVQTSRPEPGDVPTMQEKKGPPSMKPPADQLDEGLSASLQVLPLVPGLYLFSVTAAPPAGERGNGALRLPAMHVGLGPGVRPEHVEFVAGPGSEGAWLFARGDVLVAKVNSAGATLVLTSVRAATGDVLSIEVERLEARVQANQVPAVLDKAAVNLPSAAAHRADARATEAPGSRAVPQRADDGTIPLQVKTHMRSRGDMTFTDTPWAGRVAPGLWMEAFSLQPMDTLGAHNIEYKGLTGTGFETPWLSDDQNCGTKGMSVPLVGFAVRLRGSPETAAYDCEYSGYFQSGTVVGPLRNGAPCRSTVANDPLEGVQVRVTKRTQAAGFTAKPIPTRERSEGPRAAIEPARSQQRTGAPNGGDDVAMKKNTALKRSNAEGTDPGTRSAPRA